MLAAASSPNNYAGPGFTLFTLCLTVCLGLLLGTVRFGTVHLGLAGVLFAGLGLGHFHAASGLSPDVLQFVKELGLVLFVYSIGMQVGPGFASSLRRDGLKLNALAFGIVLTGAGLTVGLTFLFGFDMAAGVGLFAGATTNTPALGAAQEVLRHVPAAGENTRLALPGLAYAVAYPFGVIGIILAMNVARRWLKINVADELRAHEETRRAGRISLHRLNVEVINPNLDGLHLSELPALNGSGIVISRILKAGSEEVRSLGADETIQVGDHLLAVGPPAELRKFRLAVGHESHRDLMQVAGPVDFRRAVLTQKEMVGRTLRALAWNHRHGVTVTRLTRAEIEMPIDPDLELRYGDVLQIVGATEALEAAIRELGNSPKDLNHTQLLPLFLGIAVGVIIGATPFYLPGVPAAVKLGLAGGPLLAGLLFSRLGRLGPLLWHAPTNVTMLLREFGIALFLACVGLVAGEHFMGAVFSGQGLLWLGCGAVITLVPLALATWVGRRWFKLNYVTLCGLLSGSMTDPPALAFANQAVNSDAPNVAYAAVYPLTMILRIIAAQSMVLLFLR